MFAGYTCALNASRTLLTSLEPPFAQSRIWIHVHSLQYSPGSNSATGACLTRPVWAARSELALLDCLVLCHQRICARLTAAARSDSGWCLIVARICRKRPPLCLTRLIRITHQFAAAKLPIPCISPSIMPPLFLVLGHL